MLICQIEEPISIDILQHGILTIRDCDLGWVGSLYINLAGQTDIQLRYLPPIICLGLFMIYITGIRLIMLN